MKKNKGNTHIPPQILTYGMLILAGIIIGFVSPHGMLKSLYTLFFMFVSTFGIQSAIFSIKPLISNATRYGKKHLKQSIILDKKIIDLNFIDGDSLSSVMILGVFLQIFVVNYFVQRYTGFQILDGYIIIFWSLVQLGIRFANFFFRYKSGKNIKLLTNVINETDNKGKPKINIILSTIAVVILIFILKNNPILVETPEMYLEKVEDLILENIMPNTKIQKYKTKI